MYTDIVDTVVGARVRVKVSSGSQATNMSHDFVNVQLDYRIKSHRIVSYHGVSRQVV